MIIALCHRKHREGQVRQRIKAMAGAAKAN